MFTQLDCRYKETLPLIVVIGFSFIHKRSSYSIERTRGHAI